MGDFETYLSYFTHLLWPDHCPVCGRVAVSHCPECLGSVVSPLGAFCLDCGGPYGVNCCYNSVPCYAAAIHDGQARDFILKLKYRNARNIAHPMGRLIARAFCKIEADIVIPVPLHKSSPRGYNQSELIAQGIAEEWGMSVNSGLLNWNVDIGTQMGKAGQARSAIPPNAINASESLFRMRIVLVDDVYTTGGTLRAAKLAVENAGGIVAGALIWSRRLPSLESEVAWQDIDI